MRIDFEEVTPRHNKIKKVTIVVLVILFITMFGVLGIYYAKLYNFNFTSIINIKNNYKENIEQTTQNKIEDEENVNMQLPQYTKNSQKEINNIYNSKTKIAYLTFDDGPSQAVTPLILDVLKEQNIKATFFVLGTYVKRNPELVKRAYEEGHYIANHGYSHNYEKIYKNANNVLEEYNKTEKAIQEAIGIKEYSSYLFRFPGGYSGSSYAKIKKQAAQLLNKNNISYIDWNVLTGDAQGANTKDKILKNIKKYTNNKGNIVVLMHDSSSKILTYETLTDVINYLKSEGYTFDNFYNIMK